MSPLPFAPPPKDSSLYQQLESTTLQTLTADQLDTIRAKTFSQGTDGNEDEYRRLLLLGLAAQQISVSGPIPNTGQHVSQTKDDSSGTLEMWTGSEHIGEVWKLVAADMDPNNTNIRVRLRLYNSNNTEKIELGDETGHGSAEPFNPTATWGGDFTIDQNANLRAYCDGMAAGRSVTVNIYMIRVR
jgi:hypothetical protein